MDRATTLPRSLSGWFTSLWTQLLFSGPSSASTAPLPRSHLLLLLILPAILLYPCLDFRLFEPDESRYAQIPREMHQRGDLLVPTLQSEPYLDKPPLFYWLVMACYQLFGYHDWAARLVPAMAVHAAIVVTYLLGRRSLGEPTALVGAMLLMLAPGFIGVSRLLILDGLLTLFVCLSLFATFEAIRGATLNWKWWLVAATACGLGVLTKGPVAVLLLVPPVWLYCRLSGQSCTISVRARVVFAAVVLAIVLPWYVALCVRLPEFVGYFFWEHNVQRFLMPNMHVRGVWFYLPLTWLMLLPGTLLIWPVLRFLFASDVESTSKRSPELGFHLLSGVWIVFFFTLSSGKLPTYILPALPFLALVVGRCVVAKNWQRSKAVQALACASLAFLLLGHYLAIPWYANYRSPMSKPAEVLALCADPAQSIACFPRNCDSIAFYLGRSDLKTIRTQNIEELRTLVRIQPRTVILCTHRSSLQGLKQLLPPEVRIVQEVRMGLADIPGVPASLMKPLKRLMGETALGLGDLAVVEMPRLVEEQRRMAQRKGE